MGQTGEDGKVRNSVFGRLTNFDLTIINKFLTLAFSLSVPEVNLDVGEMEHILIIISWNIIFPKLS